MDSNIDSDNSDNSTQLIQIHVAHIYNDFMYLSANELAMDISTILEKCNNFNISSIFAICRWKYRSNDEYKLVDRFEKEIDVLMELEKNNIDFLHYIINNDKFKTLMIRNCLRMVSIKLIEWMFFTFDAKDIEDNLYFFADCCSKNNNTDFMDCYRIIQSYIKLTDAHHHMILHNILSYKVFDLADIQEYLDETMEIYRSKTKEKNLSPILKYLLTNEVSTECIVQIVENVDSDCYHDTSHDNLIKYYAKN